MYSRTDCLYRMMKSERHSHLDLDVVSIPRVLALALAMQMVANRCSLLSNFVS